MEVNYIHSGQAIDGDPCSQCAAYMLVQEHVDSLKAEVEQWRSENRPLRITVRVNCVPNTTDHSFTELVIGDDKRILKACDIKTGENTGFGNKCPRAKILTKTD